ncbi:hypothetical protein [Clostridioides difficile]|uniref:hypothetical protein n=1 Tax=Clostridioides difficile TaxID=1496 RepID=UPI00057736D8|nr:hypothetical protein [Clostridioides difficile]
MNKRHSLPIVSVILLMILITFNNNQNYITMKEVFNVHIMQSQNKKIKQKYYLTKDGWLLGNFAKLLSDYHIKSYSKAINNLSKLNRKKDFYFVSLPHKTNMLKHLYPSGIEGKNNIDINKENLEKQLTDINFLDIDDYFYRSFTEKEREKFFLKTDHHGNSLGAFEEYKFILDKLDLGLSKSEIDSHLKRYSTRYVNDKVFIGSYNKKMGYPLKKKESISYVEISDAKYKYFISNGTKNTEINENIIKAKLKDKREWDYGGAYMRGCDCHILKIRNSSSLTNKKALIFRDSYQAPMTWMLADTFKELEILDPRYIKNIDMTYDEIIKNSNANVVLFMYNSFGFAGMIQEMIDKGIA